MTRKIKTRNSKRKNAPDKKLIAQTVNSNKNEIHQGKNTNVTSKNGPRQIKRVKIDEKITARENYKHPKAKNKENEEDDCLFDNVRFENELIENVSFENELIENVRFKNELIENDSRSVYNKDSEKNNFKFDNEKRGVYEFNESYEDEYAKMENNFKTGKNEKELPKFAKKLNSRSRNNINEEIGSFEQDKNSGFFGTNNPKKTNAKSKKNNFNYMGHNEDYLKGDFERYKHVILSSESEDCVSGISTPSFSEIPVGSKLLIRKDMGYGEDDVKAEVLACRENEIYVHYADFNRRLDEWIALSAVVSVVEWPKKKKRKEALSEESMGAIRNINYIQINNKLIRPWYFSPYPEKICRSEVVYICDFCLFYFGTPETYLKHDCGIRHPTGNEIYRDE
ncbi:Histone acetyltransferase ESA1, partial [Dictyocoela roeselum]